MTINKKVRVTLPIETEAYKAEQKFLAQTAANERLDAGETLTDPKTFPPNTPSDVIAVTRGKPVRMKEKGSKMKTATLSKTTDIKKLPDAKAKNSKTTADVRNPRKNAKADAKATAKKAPAKKGSVKKDDAPGRGRSSRYSGKTVYATAETIKTNPRRDQTAGWHFLEPIRKAGKKGIKYDELRNTPHFGTSHLIWDIDKGHITVK